MKSLQLLKTFDTFSRWRRVQSNINQSYINIHQCLEPGIHPYTRMSWSNVECTNLPRVRHDTTANDSNSGLSLLRVQSGGRLTSSSSCTHCHCSSADGFESTEQSMVRVSPAVIVTAPVTVLFGWISAMTLARMTQVPSYSSIS